MKGLIVFLIYFQILSILFLKTNSLRFHLPSGGVKCVHDEMDKNDIVVGEYSITEGVNSKVSIEVKDQIGHIFFKKADAVSGKFTFSSETDDTFDICFRSVAAQGTKEQHEVYLDVKQGAEAKNIDAIAEAENLKPIEAELKKVEYLTDSIVKDFISMHSRADAMRNINASTHSRVLYFSVFSMLCLMALAIWQVLYLRRYFKSKKLIE